MIKIVAFDGDGVVFDSLPVHYLYGICGVLTKHRLPAVSFSDFRLTCYPPFEKWWGERGVDLPTKELWEIYHQCLGDCRARLIPGVISCLEALKTGGAIISLITASESSAERTLFEHSIQHFFQHIFLGELNKGARLTELSLLYQVSPQEIVMVGDMPSDMRDAQSAGARSIGFNHPYSDCTPDILSAVTDSLTSAGASRVLRSMEELKLHLFAGLA